jgi:antitoxin VapB
LNVKRLPVHRVLRRNRWPSAALFIIELSTRRVEIVGIASKPDSAWMSQVADCRSRYITQAVVVALRERLARRVGRSSRRRLRDELREIAQRCAQLPTLDDRSDEEILGYDERGLPR